MTSHFAVTQTLSSRVGVLTSWSGLTPTPEGHKPARVLGFIDSQYSDLMDRHDGKNCCWYTSRAVSFMISKVSIVVYVTQKKVASALAGSGSSAR